MDIPGLLLNNNSQTSDVSDTELEGAAAIDESIEPGHIFNDANIRNEVAPAAVVLPKALRPAAIGPVWNTKEIQHVFLSSLHRFFKNNGYDHMALNSAGWKEVHSIFKKYDVVKKNAEYTNITQKQMQGFKLYVFDRAKALSLMLRSGNTIKANGEICVSSDFRGRILELAQGTLKSGVISQKDAKLAKQLLKQDVSFIKAVLDLMLQLKRLKGGSSMRMSLEDRLKQVTDLDANNLFPDNIDTDADSSTSSADSSSTGQDSMTTDATASDDDLSDQELGLNTPTNKTSRKKLNSAAVAGSASGVNQMMGVGELGKLVEAEILRVEREQESAIVDSFNGFMAVLSALDPHSAAGYGPFSLLEISRLKKAISSTPDKINSVIRNSFVDMVKIFKPSTLEVDHATSRVTPSKEQKLAAVLFVVDVADEMFDGHKAEDMIRWAEDYA